MNPRRAPRSDEGSTIRARVDGAPWRPRWASRASALLGLVLIVLGTSSFFSGHPLAAPVLPPPSAASPAAGSGAEGAAFDAMQSGYKCFIQGRWKDALAHLERSVRLNPGSADAQYLLGMTCLQLLQYPQAEKAFLQVVRIEQRSYRGYSALANTALAAGQFDVARKYARSIFDFDRKSFIGWYCVGVIDYKQGRLGDALYNWGQSRAYWEDYAPNLFNLAVANYNQRSAQQAVVRLRKATILEPKKALYSFMLGWISYMINDMSSAFIHLNRCITDDKTAVYANTARALLAIRQQRYDEATRCIDIALAKDPDMGKAWVLKGILLARVNKRDEAVAALREALAIDTLDVDARDGLQRLGVTPPPPGPARGPRLPSASPAPSASPGPAGSPGPAASPGPAGSPAPAGSASPAPSPSARPPSRRPSASPRPMVPPPGVPVPR